MFVHSCRLTAPRRVSLFPTTDSDRYGSLAELSRLLALSPELVSGIDWSADGRAEDGRSVVGS